MRAAPASGVALTAHAFAWAHERGLPVRCSPTGASTNLLASRFWPRRGFRTDLPAAATARFVKRIPLLAGSRIAVVNGARRRLVLRPPPPRRESRTLPPPSATPFGFRSRASRSRRSSLAAVARRSCRTASPAAAATPLEPRPAAVAATVDELARSACPSERQTILVAGGLARRTSRPRARGASSHPISRAASAAGRRARRGVRRARVARRPVGARGARAPRAASTPTSSSRSAPQSPSSTAARACSSRRPTPATCRAADAYSLLETAASQGWQLGVAIERALARRVAARRHVARAHAAALDRAAPGLSVRARVARTARSARPCGPSSACCRPDSRQRALRSLPASRGVSAAFAGSPSIAHAEALLRGTEERARSLAEPVDVMCLGIPVDDAVPAARAAEPAARRVPRARPGAAALARCVPGRRRRHGDPRSSVRPAVPAPERSSRTATSSARFAGLARERPDARPRGRARRRHDERAIAAYRERRTHHPLLPFADWSACGPHSDASAPVLVAGCRDHDAARALGFVPDARVGAAVQMAESRAEGPLRIGFLRRAALLPAVGFAHECSRSRSSARRGRSWGPRRPPSAGSSSHAPAEPWGVEHAGSSRRMGQGSARPQPSESDRTAAPLPRLHERRTRSVLRDPRPRRLAGARRAAGVYECSHLGGHRFAANVLVLPDGLIFGRLDARSTRPGSPRSSTPGGCRSSTSAAAPRSSPSSRRRRSSSAASWRSWRSTACALGRHDVRARRRPSRDRSPPRRGAPAAPRLLPGRQGGGAQVALRGYDWSD